MTFPTAGAVQTAFSRYQINPEPYRECVTTYGLEETLLLSALRIDKLRRLHTQASVTNQIERLNRELNEAEKPEIRSRDVFDEVCTRKTRELIENHATLEQCKLEII